MSKSKKIQKIDKRVTKSERQVAIADPRMPVKLESQVVLNKDWTLTRPKDLPGMNGSKIKSVEQLKAYVSRIPPAPSSTR